MTLPASGTAAAAQRAVDLVDAVERAGDPAGAEAHVIDVLRRWNDAPDTSLDEQFEAVLAAIERLGRIFDEADVDRTVVLLNALFADVADPPRLVREPGWGWHLHVDAPDADWPTWLLASSALGLSALIAEQGRLPWGRCHEADCRRPFLDRGRRSPQRYCSHTCATRARVRRHRARP